MLEKIKNFKWIYILIGVFLAVLGVCFISFNSTYNVLATVIGIITAACGVGIGVAALIKRERNFKFAFMIALAICCIVCGIVTAITQSQAINVIANIFFLLLLIDGAFKLQLSIASARFSFFGWWIISVGSTALIICSFLMAKFTPSDEVQLSVFTGILLIYDGILNALSSFWNTAVLKATPFVDKETKKREKKAARKVKAEKSDSQKDESGDAQAEQDNSGAEWKFYPPDEKVK